MTTEEDDGISGGQTLSPRTPVDDGVSTVCVPGCGCPSEFYVTTRHRIQTSFPRPPQDVTGLSEDKTWCLSWCGSPTTLYDDPGVKSTRGTRTSLSRNLVSFSRSQTPQEQRSVTGEVIAFLPLKEPKLVPTSERSRLLSSMKTDQDRRGLSRDGNWSF